MMEKFPGLPDRRRLLSVLAVACLAPGGCGVDPTQLQSDYVHCDGLTVTDMGDTYDIDPIVTVKPGGEQPTAVREGIAIGGPTVPYGKPLRILKADGVPTQVTLVIETSDPRRIASCPAMPV